MIKNKNKVFKTRKAFSLSILLGIILLAYSCDKNDNESIDRTLESKNYSVQSVPIVEIGGAHNDVLQYLKMNNVDKDSALFYASDYMVEEYGYSEEDIDQIISEMINNDKFEILQGNSLSNLSASDINNYVYEACTGLEVEQELGDFVLDIYDKSMNENISIETVYEEVEDFENNFPFTGELENEVISVFTDVYYNSYEVWTGDGDNEDTKTIIVADALGSLHGLIWGAAGSIIEGAVASYIAADECEDY